MKKTDGPGSPLDLDFVGSRACLACIGTVIAQIDGMDRHLYYGLVFLCFNCGYDLAFKDTGDHCFLDSLMLAFIFYLFLFKY